MEEVLLQDDDTSAWEVEVDMKIQEGRTIVHRAEDEEARHGHEGTTCLLGKQWWLQPEMDRFHTEDDLQDSLCSQSFVHLE
jgi:hypothetical protein